MKHKEKTKVLNYHNEKCLIAL